MSFTLQPNRWYGWQMIPGYEGDRCVPFFCPCLIREVTAHKSGKGFLTLNVWVTGYAEGVNDGEAPLKVLFRGENYLVAQILYPDAPQIKRCVVISHIEFEWVRRFCPQLWKNKPPESFDSAALSSISFYLDQVFQPDGGKQQVVTDDRPWWPVDEDATLVMNCALRFDGAKYDQELGHPSVGTYAAIGGLYEDHFEQTLELYDDDLKNMAVFFWLQRCLKWSGQLDRRACLVYVKLFLHLHDKPVPRGYEKPEWLDIVKYGEIEQKKAGKLAESLRALMPDWS